MECKKTVNKLNYCCLQSSYTLDKNLGGFFMMNDDFTFHESMYLVGMKWYK